MIDIAVKIVRIANGWLLITPSEDGEGEVIRAFTYDDEGDRQSVAWR